MSCVFVRPRAGELQANIHVRATLCVAGAGAATAVGTGSRRPVKLTDAADGWPAGKLSLAPLFIRERASHYILDFWWQIFSQPPHSGERARQTGSEWQGSIWQVCSRTAGSQPSGAERGVFLKAPANTLHEMKILDYTFPSSASLPLSCRALSLLAAASLLLANGEPLSGVYKHRELSCLAGGKPAASRPLAAFT